MNSIQYTIRNVPEPVDKALRKRAQKQNSSFNQTVIDALKQATGNTNQPRRLNKDLDWFIGSGVGPADKRAERKAQKWLDNLPMDDTNDRPSSS